MSLIISKSAAHADPNLRSNRNRHRRAGDEGPARQDPRLRKNATGAPACTRYLLAYAAAE